jgi:hypothetical protein
MFELSFNYCSSYQRRHQHLNAKATSFHHDANVKLITYSGICTIALIPFVYLIRRKVEDTKGAIRNSKLKKDRQQNGHKEDKSSYICYN